MTAPPSKAAMRIRYCAIVLLILLPVSALGSRFGIWPFTIGLLLLAIAMLGGVFIQVINAIWLLRGPVAETKTVLRWSSLIALPPLVLFAVVLNSAGNLPSIHHISTDTDNPPEFIAAISERGENSNPLIYTPELAETQKAAYPEVQTLQTPLAPGEAFTRALATANQLGWEIYAQDSQKGHLEAVDTTFWFGFKDDVVIRITPATGGGSLVDLRSVSRVGVGDAGKNAQRISHFLEAFAGH